MKEAVDVKAFIISISIGMERLVFNYQNYFKCYNGVYNEVGIPLRLILFLRNPHVST